MAVSNQSAIWMNKTVTNIALLVVIPYESIHYMPAYKMIINELNEVPGSKVRFDFTPVWHPAMISCLQSHLYAVENVSSYYYKEKLSRNITVSMSPRKEYVIIDKMYVKL